MERFHEIKAHFDANKHTSWDPCAHLAAYLPIGAGALLEATHCGRRPLLSWCCRPVLHALKANLIPGMLRLPGMLSGEGRCKTLDTSADGYVRGESVGALLLRPLEQAGSTTSGRVLAVLRGSAVNQDGRSSALTAPNGVAQQVCNEAIRF